MITPQNVQKRNGNIAPYDQNKIKNTLIKAAFGYEKDIDLNAVINQVEKELFDNIPTKKISQTLIMVVRSFIEKDPAYSKLAARLLLYQVYSEVFQAKINYQDIEKQYRENFLNNIKLAAKEKRLDPRLLLFDLDQIALLLQPQRDDLFQYLGLQTLTDRYFLRTKEDQRILETPQYFFMRVAMGLAINEEEPLKHIAQFYEMMSTLRFVPSTPTLFHSGTQHPQLSSCYITTVQDSLENIFKSIGDNAQMSKWSGGIGNDWTNIRGMGSLINGTRVESQGVVPFLKIANDTTVAINRSGRRRGATCAYLEVWHYDFEDFLELRRNTGDERRRTHDMSTAAWVPDLFMKRVIADQSWTLFSPDEVPDLHHIYGQDFEKRYQIYEEKAARGEIKLFKQIKAQELWRKMLTMLFETGHPWITFKDPSNVRSPQDHAGTIHSSNLCTEITLNTSENETAVCNLGSINLARHINSQQLDKEKLAETIGVAMRMLDNVIDINFYPTIEGKNSNIKNRPIGLGIMGYQDALYQMNINFDSDEAIKFADQSMELISYHAILTSSQLAAEKGSYSTFNGSKWDRGIMPHETINLLESERGRHIPINKTPSLDWDVVRAEIKKNGMRNSNCLAIAPTATISNIADCSPTTEPTYKNIYVKSNMSGEFTIVNRYLIEDLKKINLWNNEILNQLKRHDGDISAIDIIPQNIRAKYKETFAIEAEWLIKAAAERGKWIDQSQSLNIFLKTTSGKRLSEVYQYAWDMGLKTTYYLRTLAASGVEKSTLSLQEQNLKQSTSQSIETEIPATPVEPDPIVPPTGEPKLCRIADPDCESCQ